MNNISVEFLINLVVFMVPYNLSGYYAFRRHRRCSALLSAAGFALITAASCAFAIWLMSKGVNPKLTEYVFGFIYFGWFVYCININFFKLLFYGLFVLEYIIALRGTSIFITSMLFSSGAVSYYSIQNTAVYVALLLATGFPAFILSNKIARRIIRADDTEIWKFIWIIPAMTVVIIQVFTGMLKPEITGEWTFMITRIFMLLGAIAVYYVLLYVLEESRKRTVMEERAKRAEAVNDLNKAQYRLMKKRIEETRIARHDLRQHLNLIQAYLEKGDKAALESYLSEYGKSLPEDTGELYCKNYAVDVVMRYYTSRAKSEGTEFETRLAIPEDISVSEPDICVVFGNLLENALEACARQNSGRRFIKVCSKIIGEKAISLTVDNSCDREPKITEDGFVSSKRDDVGTGIISVKNIAEKYNGVASFDYKNGVFYASVLLNP